MVTAFRIVDGRLVVALLIQSESEIEYAVTVNWRKIET